MSVNQITDYEGRILSLLPTQFRNKENFEKLLQIFAAKCQELEDVDYALTTQRNLSNAVGTQLDGLGEILGESRLGRNDADYRAALQVRIGINLSSGQPEKLISVFATVTGADKVDYHEVWPAGVNLNARGGTEPNNLVTNMAKIKAAGVRLTLTISTTTPFGFAGDPGVLGFGSTVDPNIGGKLGSTIT